MKILLYENEIDHFFTAVYHSYYSHKDAERFSQEAESVTMLDEGIFVEKDSSLAGKVRQGIKKHGGNAVLCDIEDAFCSGNPQKGQIIAEYLAVLFKNGRKTREMFAHPAVIAFNDVLNKVRMEGMRLVGFIRLQELEGGVFYGYFTSDNDQLERILPHFIDRFNTMKLLLHDTKRNKMVYYDGQHAYRITPPEGATVVLSENEEAFQSLWRLYFNAVSIESRKNLKQQMRFLPKKYRDFLLEFTDL